MKKVILVLVFILLFPYLAMPETQTVGVTCSCDPPGTYRPPGTNCRDLCAPKSGGGSQSGASFQQQITGTIVNSAVQGFIQGFMQGMQTPPPQPDPAVQAEMERQRAEAERQQQEALRKAQAEQEQRHKNLMSGLKGVYDGPGLTMKDESPPPMLQPSILPEAQALLLRCNAADEDASRLKTSNVK